MLSTVISLAGYLESVIFPALHWKDSKQRTDATYIALHWICLVSIQTYSVSPCLKLLVDLPPVIFIERYREVLIVTGGDNSNKRCFGTKPKLFRESGDFSGNRDTWKFFRETRDNSGTLQECRNFSGNVSQQFGRMIQISGTT